VVDLGKILRSGHRDVSLRGALQLPATTLLGVTAEAGEALAAIGIHTTFDLGASAHFATARLVAEAGAVGSMTSELGLTPADWLSTNADPIPQADLGDAPIAALGSLSAEAAAALSEALGVGTIREFAFWPPQQTAREMVAIAVGSSVDAPAEPGDELRPRLGEFPTERVYYDKLVMLSLGGDGPTVEIEGPIPLDKAVDHPFGFGKPAVGALLTFSQSWFAKGVTLGQMLHSLALAPGEATRIAVIDWARRTAARVTETIAETEALSSTTSHARAISEVQNAVASEMQEGESMSSGWATSETEADAWTTSSGLLESLASSGSDSHAEQSSRSRSGARSTSWSVGNRSTMAEMTQDINDRTEQHSNSVRNRRATAVREVSQSEHEEVSTRIVANYNHMHALTVQYYEVVQVYRVETARHQVARCLFLPFKLPDFGGAAGAAIIERFRPALTAAALTARTRDLLTDDTTSVALIPMTPIELPIPPFGLDHAITPGDLGTAGLATFSLGTASADTDADGAQTPPQPGPAKSLVWDPTAVSRVSREIGRRIFRRGSNAVYLPDDALLTGIAFSGVNLASLRLDRAEPGDEIFEIASGGGRLDLPPNTRLRDIDSILVARAANDTLHAGSMTLYCNYLGRQFAAPEIPLQLRPGTQMQRVLRLQTDTVDRQKELRKHLEDNADHYGRAILRSLDSATLLTLLSGLAWNGRPVSELVEPNVVAVAGNFVVLRAPAEAADSSGVSEAGNALTWGELLISRRLNEPLLDARTVPIPTDGVFAEAVLGRSNSAEKLDITRFWNWQDSPIPLQPPDIAPVATGSRGTPETLEPGQLGAPVLNIVNPTSLPDPTGLGASLSAIATSNMFRDMSGLAGSQSLAQDALGKTLSAATEAGKIASTNLQAEAQKAVAMGQIAADIAKTAMGIPKSKSTDGISAEGARINQGRSMDERGLSEPGSPSAPGVTSKGGIGGAGSSDVGGSSTQSGGSAGSSGMRMNTSREAAYSDHGALGYSPGGLGALSKLVGDVPLEPAVFGKEDVQKATQLAPHWRNLLKFKVPADVVSAIERRDMRVQTLADGAGDLALDSYPVLIGSLPMMNGSRMDSVAFIEHIRKNLNSFVDNFWADFLPYSAENPEDPNPDGADDVQRWQSADPVKAVFDIDIPGDNGAVVCSAHDATGWIFSTVEAPDPGLHPVSGHRGWQIFEVKDATGVYIIHTMGADRKTKLAQDFFWAGSMSQRKLWTSFQQRVAAFVNDNGGQAEIMDPEVHAMSWEIVVIQLGL
jgi:hypothetical protein